MELFNYQFLNTHTGEIYEVYCDSFAKAYLMALDYFNLEDAEGVDFYGGNGLEFEEIEDLEEVEDLEDFEDDDFDELVLTAIELELLEDLEEIEDLEEMED